MIALGKIHDEHMNTCRSHAYKHNPNTGFEPFVNNTHVQCSVLNDIHDHIWYPIPSDKLVLVLEWIAFLSMYLFFVLSDFNSCSHLIPFHSFGFVEHRLYFILAATNNEPQPSTSYIPILIFGVWVQKRKRATKANSLISYLVLCR